MNPFAISRLSIAIAIAVSAANAVAQTEVIAVLAGHAALPSKSTIEPPRAHLGPEGLTVIDANHIVVVNDNNFPYSSGRTLGQPDDNELTLLDIRALVDAK